MGISIVNYTVSGDEDNRWGVLKDQKIWPLAGDYASHREVMTRYFSSRQAFEEAIGDSPIETENVTFNSPVSADVQLFCQGLNYADHREESGRSAHDSGESLIFMKAASSICAPNETIVRPKGCQLLDYEIELALVLKQEIQQETQILEADLPRYIGGLVLCNDVSARDSMFGASMLQWFKGKSYRTFCPMGPVLYLLDPEDFRHLYNLQLTLEMNGEIKQSASTGALIHRPAETLTEISTYANMSTGDCLLTGTPGGVLAQSSIKVGMSILLNFTNDQKRRRKFTQAQLAQTRFLEPGDELDLSIATPCGAIDLGRQRNGIRDA